MADDFTPPGRSEDYPGNPQGYDRLLAELSAIKTRLSDLPHGLLRQAGISVEPGVLRVTQDLAIDGQATVAGDLTTSGATTLGGDVAITGTLSLPAGIIDNDALANPIQTAADSDSVADLAFPGSEAAVFSSPPLVVPAGFTTALATVIATARCYNTTASSIYFGIRPRLDISSGAWQTGATMQTLLPPAVQGTVSSPMVASKTVEGGQTLVFSVLAFAGPGTAATAGNFAGFSWTVLFGR